MKKVFVSFLACMLGMWSGLRAQTSAPSAFNCEFQGAPEGFTWYGESGAAPHVSTYAALTYYKEELQGGIFHPGTSNYTMTYQLSEKAEEAETNLNMWLFLNPEPQMTQKVVQKIAEGTRAWNAYVAASEALNTVGTCTLYVRTGGSSNNYHFAVGIEGFTVKDEVSAYGLTETVYKSTDTVRVDLTKDFNLTVYANRYESNDALGQPLKESLQSVTRTSVLTAAEMSEAWGGKQPTIAELLNKLRDKSIFNQMCVTGTKEFYTTALNPNYSSELRKWKGDKLVYDSNIQTAQDTLNLFRQSLAKLYIDANITIPSQFTFADLYDISKESDLERYKIAEINGQRHILTFPEQPGATLYYSLLGTNRYTEVNQLGVERGAIRTSITGELTKASFDNPRPYVSGGTQEVWRATDENGLVEAVNFEYPTPEQGYITRSAFAMQLFKKDDQGNIVNMTERHFVPNVEVSGTADYRVFKVEYWNRSNATKDSEDVTFYTNFSAVDGRPIGNEQGRSDAGYTEDGDGFLYVLDKDFAEFVPKPVKNVVYLKEGKYVCENAIFSDVWEADAPSSSTIYVKYPFKAYKLSYERKFPARSNPVMACLPFELKEGDVQPLNAGGNRSDEGGIVKLMVFDGYREGSASASSQDKFFWFKQVEAVPANRPCVIRFSMHTLDGPANSVYFGDMTGRDVSASPMPSNDGRREGGLAYVPEQGSGTCYGLFKGKKAGELEGDGYSIYTFSGGKMVQASGSARLWAGRAYIALDIDLSKETPASANKLAVRFADADGNEETGGSTTGVGEVAAGAAFSAVGGVRAIEITSDRAQEVKIYAIDGKLIESRCVGAGNTSVPVGAGAYVVNGKKVIVK